MNLSYLKSIDRWLPKKKEHKNSPRSLDRFAPMIMVLPSVVFTLLLIGFPLIYVIYLMFTKWSPGVSFWGLPFVGFDNILLTFKDALFWKATWITLKISGISLFFELVLGVYLGILLSKAVRGIKVLRILFFFPAIIPSVAAGMVWVQLFEPSLGFVNYVLQTFNLPAGKWLNDPGSVIYALSIVDIWQWTPFIALIVLGGVQALPEEPFEAAYIDGANKAQTLFYIILPMLKQTILIALMLRSVDMLRIFDTIYVMTQGGPINSSTSLNIYAYQQGFLYTNMGQASTMMLVLLFIVMGFSYLLTSWRKRYV
ncbi:sugar ABC transporter permease [Bacillus sp. FJAT-50079]|uniref:carbohydrate ABC transporter permease n=1 Tax=Bacillus sp. FJAT-50079 TaxID=2833577 RepID=UPI001BCA5461|nr:sugar ABC transporter permease [Bacillus sp. FJAT-50079]MBS4206601.1 sugar ABC transporter permease [Bacillus sp. FJAT-50079]